MKNKKKIGISTHYIEKEQPHAFLYKAYSQVIINLGHIPILIPLIDKQDILESLVDELDGVLISGGGPGLTDIQRSWKLREQNPTRYDFESTLINICLKKKVPLMGICRGFQTIAEVLGGDLNLKINSNINHRQSEPVNTATHDMIIIDKSSLIFKALKKEKIKINSIHSQSVSVLPSSLKCTAICPDDEVFECYESVPGFEPFILGVQFHPEKMYKETAIWSNIFVEFLKKCKLS